jgi:hypothetical protein
MNIELRRENKRLYMQKYRAAHKETYAAYQKEYFKKYRAENVEYIRNLNKEYKAKNKDKIREQNRDYRLKNQDWLLKYDRDRYETRKRSSTYAASRRARSCRRRAMGEVPVVTIQQVYEENIKKFGTLTCELCFKPIQFGQDSLEHFHPVSRIKEYTGADIHERSNLGVAHDGVRSAEKCNNHKYAMTLEEWFARRK